MSSWIGADNNYGWTLSPSEKQIASLKIQVRDLEAENLSLKIEKLELELATLKDKAKGNR